MRCLGTSGLENMINAMLFIAVQVVLETECLSGLLLALVFDWNEDDTILSVLSCLHSVASYGKIPSSMHGPLMCIFILYILHSSQLTS